MTDTVIIPTKTDAVIWDLDGTLLSSEGIFEELINEISPIFNLEPPSLDTMRANFHGSLSDSILGVFEGRLSQDQLSDFVDHFLEKQIDKYIDIDQHILDDALRLSQALSKKGIRQIIVTNRNHKDHGIASPRSIVERSSLKDHIHHIICGDDSEIRKPHQDVMGNTLEEWNINPRNLVVIGDQHVDAQLALNLGARGIIVSRNDAEFAHQELNNPNWQKHVSLVSSLHEVIVSK